MFFRNRIDAGEKLAARFPARDYAGWTVVGIARGGAIVGAQIAKALGIPLNVLVVAKEPVPNEGILYVTSLGTTVFVRGEELVFSDAHGLKGTAKTQEDIHVRSRRYNGDTPILLDGRRIILVDDGIFSGFTFIAARDGLLQRGAHPEIAAFPVVPPWVPGWLKEQPCELVTWRVSTMNAPTGMFYDSFDDVNEEEITLIGADRNAVR